MSTYTEVIWNFLNLSYQKIIFCFLILIFCFTLLSILYGHRIPSYFSQTYLPSLLYHSLPSFTKLCSLSSPMKPLWFSLHFVCAKAKVMSCTEKQDVGWNYRIITWNSEHLELLSGGKSAQFWESVVLQGRGSMQFVWTVRILKRKSTKTLHTMSTLGAF